MNRKTLDRLLASGGVVIAAVLLVAGVLLTWAHSYVHDQVHSQLAAEKIYFPPKGNEALTSLPAADRAAMEQYAGQQLVTGAQAKTWADHFIAVHLDEMAGGQTYSQLSAKAIANPSDTKLAGTVATVFKGETLRSMLLNAYGWWKVSQITYIISLAAFALGTLSFLAGLFGFASLRHDRKLATAKAPVIEQITGHQANA